MRTARGSGNTLSSAETVVRAAHPTGESAYSGSGWGRNDSGAWLC